MYMNSHLKQMLFKPVNYYVIGILLLAIVYAVFSLQNETSLPSISTWLLGSFAMLLVWQFGVRMPYLGMISMERLVQFHLLLTLPIAETLLISTTASLIMPFINKTYRMNSYHIATVRALNNLAMNTIMLLTVDWILRLWLSLPLTALDSLSVKVIMFAAVVMQIINILMIYMYFLLDRKKVSKLFTPAYLFADFIYIPAGVLSALLWQADNPITFYLFCGFMVVLLFSFYGFNRRSNPQEAAFPQAGTEYPTNFLEVDQVTAAIKTRCDQLFNAQALLLLQLAGEGHIKSLLLDDEKISQKDLEAIMLAINTKEEMDFGQLKINAGIVNYMTALFKDHSGVFARLLLIRFNNQAFMVSDLNLLRLFVQRYRPGLSYALTFAALSEYKNNLEEKVKERTRQLEVVNQEKSELVEKLKMISKTDALSKLYNRRYFDALMKHYTDKPPTQLALAILDIDHFKQVNDTHGHDTGDLVIQYMAQIIKSWSEDGTTLFRYGGEEFVVLMKDKDINQAEQTLTELLNQVRTYQWSKLKLNDSLTVSIGLAHYPASALNQLFELADTALYQAKSNGRNQLVVSSH